MAAHFASSVVYTSPKGNDALSKDRKKVGSLRRRRSASGKSQVVRGSSSKAPDNVVASVPTSAAFALRVVGVSTTLTIPSCRRRPPPQSHRPLRSFRCVGTTPPNRAMPGPLRGNRPERTSDLGATAGWMGIEWPGTSRARRSSIPCSVVSPMTRRLCLLMASVTLIAISLSSCDASHTVVECVLGAHQPPGREDVCVPNAVPLSTRAKLLAAARSAAAANQGTVMRAVAVEANRQEAAHYTAGATVTGGGFVWVVEVAGHFRCSSACFGSPSAASPRGTVLTLLIDTTTFQESGLALSRRWLDLSHLGIVIVLRR